MSDVFFRVMYFVFFVILIGYELVYFRLKYILKDERLKGVGLFKFIWSTREILKGEK